MKKILKKLFICIMFISIGTACTKLNICAKTNTNTFYNEYSQKDNKDKKEIKLNKNITFDSSWKSIAKNNISVNFQIQNVVDNALKDMKEYMNIQE